jgi:hypothetical protein
MMTVDAKELAELEKGLRLYDSILPKIVANRALKNATRPMQQSARRLAPVGSTIAYDGMGKRKGASFARGGTTRRDVRFRFETSYDKAVTKGMVGVSRLKTKVGWRTHFITTGWKDRGGKRHRGKNFLQDAYTYTIDFARDNYAKETLLSFRKWAQRNLPKGRF